MGRFQLSLAVERGDQLTVGLAAEDELGLIYACPSLLEREFSPSGGSGTQESGHLNMDYELYDPNM